MRFVSCIIRGNHQYVVRSPALLSSAVASSQSLQSSSYSTCLSLTPYRDCDGKVKSINNIKMIKNNSKKYLSYYSNNNSTDNSLMGRNQQRYYPQYTIFHSNVALTFKSILPEFKKSGRNISVARKGKFLLEFSPRHSTNKKEDNKFYGATHDYTTEWSQSISIALNTEEIGQLICDIKKGKECIMYHNSHVLKTFKVIPSLEEEGSYKFSLTVGEGSVAEGDEIELNFGEIEVIKILLDNSLPYLAGWNTLMQRSLDSSLVYRKDF